MPDLQALLDQIHRLNQEATPGPWDHESHSSTDPNDTLGPYAIYSHDETDHPYLAEVAGYEGQGGPGIGHADAEFIVLARTALPQLAQALRAVVESCEETIRSVDKNLLPDERDRANRDYADTILDVITDAMEADDD